jgi:hypothetical protein
MLDLGGKSRSNQELGKIYKKSLHFVDFCDRMAELFCGRAESDGLLFSENVFSLFLSGVCKHGSPTE